MKPRFRVAALLLAAVLTLSLLPPWPVYAADDLTDAEAESASQAQDELADDAFVQVSDIADLTDPTDEQEIEPIAPAEPTDPDEDPAPDEEPAPSTEEGDSEAGDENADAAPEDDASTSEDAAEPEQDAETATGEDVAMPEDAAAIAAENALADDAEQADLAEPEADTPAITITNTVLNAPEGTSDAFSFILLAWKPNSSGRSRAVSGTYDGVTFYTTYLYYYQAVGMGLPEGGYYGYAPVTLYAGETLTLTSLPSGCSYFIMEDAIEDYYLRDLTDTLGTTDILYGSVYVTSFTESNDVTYTNVYAPNSLDLGQEVISSCKDSAQDVFTYTVYLFQYSSTGCTPLFDDAAAQVEVDTYGVEGAAAPNVGENGVLTFSQTSEAPSGMSTTGTFNVATFDLRKNQHVVLKNLGKNVGYYIEQKLDSNYAVYTYKTRVVYTTSSEDYGYSYDNRYCYINRCSVSSSVDFVNAQESITISKEVVNSDTTRDFVFNVFLIQYSPDTSDYYPMPEATYNLTYTGRDGDAPQTVTVQTRSDATHTPLTYSLDDGREGTSEWRVAQVRIAAGESVTIEDLPAGIVFDIVEVPVTNYETSATGVNATAGEDGSHVYNMDCVSDASAAFVNTYVPPVGYDLSVSKTVTGTLSDPDQSFSFQVTLTDEAEEPLSDQDIQVVLPDEREVFYGTDSSGTLTFTLSHGQQITLEDLPENTKYTLTELDTDGYVATFDVTGGSFAAGEGATLSGALDGASDVQIHVTNERNIPVSVGIRTEVQPSLVMVAIAAGGLVLLGCSKRRAGRRS